MKEIFLVLLVGTLPVMFAPKVNEINQIKDESRRIEEATQRMIENPRPIYEHYPNPERPKNPGIMEDGDQE